MSRSGAESDAAIKRKQIEILGKAESFFESRVLFALVKLGIFEWIGHGSRNVDDLAQELRVPADRLARLLSAGVALKLLRSDDAKSFRIAPACSVLLPDAGENYLGDWVRNFEYFANAISELDEAVLEARSAVAPEGHLGGDAERTHDFTLAMQNYATLRGREIARFLDTAGARTLLDLGCGPGTYAFELGLANPDLELFLLDLPEVLRVAKETESRLNLKNKVHYLGLDVVEQEIPGSYDMVLVSNTLHMLGEEASRKLIKRLHGHVNPGGSLVIQAQFLNDDRLGGRWPVLLDLIQLCITSEGRNHSVPETTQWMEASGFANIEFCPMTLLNTNSFLRGTRR